MYTVIAPKQFQKQLTKVFKKHPDLRGSIVGAIRSLEQSPCQGDSRKAIKKLSGVPAGEGQWRMHVGFMRIRYDVFEDERLVVLLHIQHRRDVYRK